MHLSVLYFWLDLSPGLDRVTAGLDLEPKNYGLGLGLVDVALTSALALYTYGLVNILEKKPGPVLKVLLKQFDKD